MARMKKKKKEFPVEQIECPHCRKTYWRTAIEVELPRPMIEIKWHRNADPEPTAIAVDPEYRKLKRRKKHA